MPSNRSAKRNASQERLRGGFLAQLGPRIRELASLFAIEGGEALDTVQAELMRVAQTAEALGLSEIAQAADEGVEVTTQGDLEPVLAPLAKVVRHTGPAPRFAPIVVVGDAELIEDFQTRRQTIVEPLVLGPSLAEVRDPLAVIPWAAFLVPVADVPAAREIAEGALVLAWGESRDWQARLDALAAGADGFIARQAAVGDLLHRVRARLGRSTTPPEVFVIAEESDRREAWMDALFDAGLTAVASNMPAEIAPALDVVCPDVLVIGGSVAGVDAEDLVRATRSHRRSHVPALVVGHELDAERLRAAGADGLLPAEIAPEELVVRVLQRHERATSILQGRHPISGAPDRDATFTTIDARLAHVVRSGTPLTIAVIGLMGLEDARARFGRAAVNAAQRLVADTLAHGVRRLDVVGQISDDAFIVALHECPVRSGRRRISALARKAEGALHADHRLRSCLCLFGVADTELGVDRVVQRADDDLLSIRI